MASPHAAGVAALIKAIHPDFTPAQVLDLMKKQAAVNYGQLADPAKSDNKEYRGTGLVNAFTAVTKDQPKPTVADAEYSTDGGTTWKPLKDATVTGKATVRVKATSSVSALSLTVAGKTDTVKAEQKTHDNALTASVDVDFTADSDQTAEITANGLNDYKDADDDVTSTVTFKSVASPANLPATADSIAALKQSAADAAAKKQSDYTAASWTRFAAAKQAAADVLAKGDKATQGEVDKAAAELKAASEALVKAEAGKPAETKPTESKPSTKPQLTETGSSVAVVAAAVLLLAVAGVSLMVWRRRRA